ncbi:MAG: BamA/TamA family outer membrane protein [Ferruginibacter sp.]
MKQPGQIFTILIIMLCLVFVGNGVSAQGAMQGDTAGFIIMKASEKYNKSAGYQKRWGRHYRSEWNSTVKFPIAHLDTLEGGVTPYRLGGGRQSNSLILRDKTNQEYVLRSIDKTFGKALPEIAQGTFIEKIVDDQVSIGHPYSALTIPPMAKAAKIYYTTPRIFYIPKQSALGEFNDSIGNHLYLFEQRPDENWETAENFGNPKNIVGTDKMIENVLEDNDKSVDQKLYLKTRLFDMLIGDWGRHEDQWRWGVFKNKDDNKTLYKPIPRDRDQAYTKFEGTMLRKAISAGGLKHLQTFDYSIKDISTYNFPARNLDYHFTNELPLATWKFIASELQNDLTDKVIEDAIKLLPREVYSLSGPEITAKLKSRRNNLPQIAEKYYRILAREVDIRGSEDSEKFLISRLSDTQTQVSVFKITNEGETKKEAFYNRIFNNNETDKIRIYGISGKDEYHVTGTVSHAVPVTLIGGSAADLYKDESVVKSGARNIIIYDNKENDFKTGGETRLKLSSDTFTHAFKYEAIQYDKRSFRPIAFYNNPDKFYVGIKYATTMHQWRKDPVKQYVDVKYSINQKAFSTTYNSLIPGALGKWDLGFKLNYDAIKWTNFYGLGNNTVLTTQNRNFYRLRTREFFASTGIHRISHNRHRLSISPFYQTIKIINDTGRFVAKNILPPYPTSYKTQNFAGGDLTYVFQALNDSILPTKGIGLLLGAQYTGNLKNNSNNFGRYGGELNVYLPITKSISLAIRGGGSTLSGNPLFYQYNSIGGKNTLRGYQRERFYGNSVIYSQNELRLIRNVRSFLYNGKLGVFGLYDIGRVWLKGETFNKWHSGYGGGIIISPFNRISVSASYGISSEDNNVYLAIIKGF